MGRWLKESVNKNIYIYIHIYLLSDTYIDLDIYSIQVYVMYIKWTSQS